MVKNWELALNTYKYPVVLGNYRNAQKHKGYFVFQPIENAHTTMLFENHFRSGAGESIELWLEVVYWKMYSQGGRRDIKTNDVERHFEKYQINANQLLTACNCYINNDTSENLKGIVRLLGFSSTSIATAATFPAFLCPDMYPMVDTRIAKWVGACMAKHNAANANAPKLVRPRYLDTTATALNLSDMAFVNSWTRWCQYISIQLSERTDRKWRARDVEMAIFNAWGDKNDAHPKIDLELIQ